MHSILQLIPIVMLMGVACGQSILLKIRDYPWSYGKVAGLFYPQFMDVEQSVNLTTKLSIYNMSSGKLVYQPFTFLRNFNNCEYAMESANYGYYQKFPFYRVIADCGNLTHQQVLNLKVYRSGDLEQIVGNVVARSSDEQNCDMGPLRVQYFYNSMGLAYSFVYRFCLRRSASSQSLYKEYSPDLKSSYAFKEESIEKVVGLTNLTLVDMQPAVGIDGKYNVYLSQTWGVIVNGGSKFIQATWKPVQKVYKIEKLCWSNSFAVLTQGYIYFLNLTFNADQSISIANLRKTDKISLDSNSTVGCNFFTIGYNAICSIYDEDANLTTWYIYGTDTKKIKTNVTEVMKGKVERPYLSDDLCSTQSFYLNNSRYQFYFPTPYKTTPKPTLTSLKLAGYGRATNFMDTGALLVSEVASYNATHQNLYLVAYNKSTFYTAPTNVSGPRITSRNWTDVRFQHERLENGYYLVSAIYAESMGNYNKTTISIYSGSTSYSGLFGYYVDIGFSDLAYFKFNNQLYNYRLVVRTPIETNAFGRFSHVASTNTLDLRYPYEFEAISFKLCSMTTPGNQMLMYRQDPEELVIMRVGLRNGNYLVLDDIRMMPQYKGYSTECAHDGLFLYSKAGKIVVLDSDLQVRISVEQSYEELKFTRSLLLLKNGPYVEVRSLANGDLIGINRWQMGDLITNIHSSGFINVKLSTYFEFGNEAPKQLKVEEEEE